MRILVTILYWFLAVLVAAVTVTCAGYTFPEALLMGVMFLPGALAAKFLVPKVSFKKKGEGILGMICLVLAILVFEYLLILYANHYIQTQRNIILQEHSTYHVDVPGIIINPLFVSFIISALTLGYLLIERWMTRRHPEIETPVTFCSERKKVTVQPSEILYVESCDTEVYVHLADGRSMRNLTGISQWESLLGPSFIRIHRSFLVNRKRIGSNTSTTITVGDTVLPVSRKYQPMLKELQIQP